MKTIKIYEPAMCCASGLCGVSIDSELLRISTLVNSLKKQGYNIVRYNLNDNPMAFVENKKVNLLLEKEGIKILPLTVFDDQVIKKAGYPSNEELFNLLGIKNLKLDMVDVVLSKESNNCDCKGGC